MPDLPPPPDQDAAAQAASVARARAAVESARRRTPEAKARRADAERRNRLAATLSMIKIAHTVFAMPFALIGWAFGVAAVNRAASSNPMLADAQAAGLPRLAQELGFADSPWLWTLIWVVIAMVGARSFAMTVNRIADLRYDAKNPRTAQRELPSGILSPQYALVFALVSASLFLGACWALNEHTLVLGPVALLVVGGYSYTKRFTALCHMFLGLGLALAPVGGWLAAVGGPFEWASSHGLIAHTGGIDPFGLGWFGNSGGGNPLFEIPGVLAFQLVPALLGLGVLFWVAGFDIIYSLQDEGFDREQGLHSMPSRIGGRWALRVARGLHLLALTAWIVAVAAWSVGAQDALFSSSGSAPTDVSGLPHGLGAFTWVGLGVVGFCLLYEHSLVKWHDISRVNAAFFTVNGVISLIFAVLVVADLFAL